MEKRKKIAVLVVAIIVVAISVLLAVRFNVFTHIAEKTPQILSGIQKPPPISEKAKLPEPETEPLEANTLYLRSQPV